MGDEPNRLAIHLNELNRLANVYTSGGEPLPESLKSEIASIPAQKEQAKRNVAEDAKSAQAALAEGAKISDDLRTALGLPVSH